MLFEKSGAEGTYRAFKHFILKLAKANTLPEYDLEVEEVKYGGEPHLRMTKKGRKEPHERAGQTHEACESVCLV